MKKKSPHQIFAIETERIYSELVHEYKSQIDRAREGFQLNVHNSFLNNLSHNLYQQSQNNLGLQSRFLIEIRHELESNKSSKFETLFDEKINAFSKKDKEFLLRNLSHLQALDNALTYINSESSKYISPYLTKIQTEIKDISITNKKSKVQWHGKTDLEFIQLVYALYEAGYLKNEDSQITNLVKQVAQIFNFELSEHWQSNLSDNINNRNADYQPKIFDKLAKAYSNYRDRLIESNKKKKLKCKYP